MKVYVKHKDTIVEIIAFVLFVVFWIAFSLIPYVIIKVIFLLLAIAVFVFIVKYPFYVTITVENNTLQYKKLIKNVSIPLDSIYYIYCEPYKRRLRYHIEENRIRLTIITDDDVTRELNDILNGEALLNDRLRNTHTDVPLMKLYEFLKEKHNPSYGTEASE